MEEQLETLTELPIAQRVARLERRDLQMFRWIRRGVRTAYLIAGLLSALVLQNTGLELGQLLAAVSP